MSCKRYKMYEIVYAISSDVIPEIVAGKIIDSDYTVEPPRYAIACHGSSCRFIANVADISNTYDDLLERYRNRLEETQRYLGKQIEKVDNLIQVLDD